jgi:F-type H+-transporting ATPase subunit gamma
VKNTRKITKAMQMVAAAKLRRARSGGSRAPCRTDDGGDVGLAAAWAEKAHEASGRDGKDKVHLLVVMTSERGLCGGFNSSIVKLARVRAAELARRARR